MCADISGTATGEKEGVFLLSTFWLAQNLARLGRVDEAEGVFETVAAIVSDVGLLSEQVDPASGTLLGNCLQQAFSHLALIQTAAALGES